MLFQQKQCRYLHYPLILGHPNILLQMARLLVCMLMTVNYYIPSDELKKLFLKNNINSEQSTLRKRPETMNALYFVFLGSPL